MPAATAGRWRSTWIMCTRCPRGAPTQNTTSCLRVRTATCPRVPKHWLSGPWCLLAWWALAIRSDDRAFHSTVPQREGFTCTLMNCWAGSLRCQSRQTGDSSLPALGTPTPAPACASGLARIARFASPVAPAARSQRTPRALVCPLAPLSTLKGTSRLWTANGPPWLAPATLLRPLAPWKTLARHWTGHLRPWTTLLTGSESILPWPESEERRVGEERRSRV